MTEPSTSKGMVTQKEQLIDADDIGSETYKFLQRIIRKIQQEETPTYENAYADDAVSRAVWYTGVHRNVMMNMLDTGKPETIEHKELIIDRRTVHYSLISLYFEKCRLPTVTELFNALKNMLPCYADIDTFKRILVKLGYVFCTYDKRKTYYVMEKKIVTFQRYKYLKTIQQYRNDKVPIYYIGILSINKAQKVLNLENTIQTDPSNIEQYIFFTASEDAVAHVNIVSSVNYEALKTWLTARVLPDLPLNSVCVLNDSKIYRKKIIEIPTLNSVKVDMVDWLEYHNVPCSISMSKSELLNLIETCTNTNDNTYEIDNIVKTYGHRLLRLPESINGLSIAGQVLYLLNKNNVLTGMTNTVLGNLSKARMNMFSECVQKEEEQLLKQDIQLDNILDIIVAATRKDTTNDDDFFFGDSDSE